MPDKVVRSGVAHTVVTSEVTKNAINPRNQFMETDKACLDDIDAFAASTVDTNLVAQQAVTQPLLQSRFDTHTSLSVAKTHITNNVQKLAPEKLTDNIQHISTHQSTRDRILYKEKKNIQENIQHISESSASRASADMSTSTSQGQPSRTQLDTIDKPSMRVEDIDVLLGEGANSFSEDELSARLRQMKEKLASANQTLKDIENIDLKNSNLDP